MSYHFLTRVFIERTWCHRAPGAAPDDWAFVPREKTGQVPIDEQVRNWVEETGARIISVSAPGMYHYWLNREMTDKCVMLSFVVVYVEGNRGQEIEPAAQAAPTPVGGQRDEAEAGPDGTRG